MLYYSKLACVIHECCCIRILLCLLESLHCHGAFYCIDLMICTVFQQEECNKDLLWYKSLEETQQSVEAMSYGQMRNMLRYGIYQIGIASQSKSPQTIHDVISVKLNPGNKSLTKTFYNLEELRNLESVLVFITGSKAECRMEVDHYLNVSTRSVDVPIALVVLNSLQILQHATRIAEILLDLQRAGNIQYSHWKLLFDCATYMVTYSYSLGMEEVEIQEESADQRVKGLQGLAKKMEEDLNLWDKEVKKSRSLYYELNYYTTLQLLRLRKELYLVHHNPTKVVDPQILALLESISPKVTSVMVQNVVSNFETELLDLPPNENDQVDIAFIEDFGNASVEHTKFHIATSTAVEVPFPITPTDKPKLTENDLTDNQKTILTDLVEYMCYSKLLVLKALEQSPLNSNHYDIQDWCDEYESIFSFENDEEEMVQESATSSDKYSSDSESTKMDIFDQQSKSGWGINTVKSG